MEQIIIRRAVKEDCPRLLELIQELAVYEKAPDEVTVTLQHFQESGFGASPVWWAFVAASPNPSKGGERRCSVLRSIEAFLIYLYPPNVQTPLLWSIGVRK